MPFGFNSLDDKNMHRKRLLDRIEQKNKEMMERERWKCLTVQKPPSLLEPKPRLPKIDKLKLLKNLAPIPVKLQPPKADTVN